MADTIINKNGWVTIEKDSQSWVVGLNHITFGIVFCDTSYTFDAHCSGGMVYEYHRYVDSIDIEVTTEATDGYYYVSGIPCDQMLVDEVIGDE